MKTSYFASKKWHGLNAVAISQGVPEWYKGRIYKELAPTWAMVKMTDEEQYTKAYKKYILSKLDPKKVYEDLGENAILLCWESYKDIKSGKTFCHRRIVAEWFEEALGIKVPELENENDEDEQLSLFDEQLSLFKEER